MPYFDKTNPRYQRAVKIMKRWNPRQQAIFSTVLADQHFAATEMGKRLKFLDYARRNKITEAGLHKRGELLDMRKDNFKRSKGQDTLAAMMGVADIGMSGYFGAKDIEAKKKLAAMMGNKLF